MFFEKLFLDSYIAHIQVDRLLLGVWAETRLLFIYQKIKEKCGLLWMKYLYVDAYMFMVYNWIIHTT